jgi:hypothetical protein
MGQERVSMSDDKPTLELRKEFMRLRKILLESSVILVTMPYHRWLTDHFVLLDVTDSDAVTDKDDGTYRLTATSGLTYKDKPSFDAPAFFKVLHSLPAWQKTAPTGWSITESEAKATILTDGTEPYAINEDTWKAVWTYYPDAEIEASWGPKMRMFRVWDGFQFIAYIAGVDIPREYREAANAIAAM